MEAKKKKGKIWRILLIILFVLIFVMSVAFVVIVKSNMSKDDQKKKSARGNAAEYSVENAEEREDSPLKGKNILFLGSSVTKGEAAQGTSFADYLGKVDGVNVTKEAVSATTLVDEFSIFAFIGYGNGDSYVTRLKEVDKDAEFDAVVVQLSTNDATMAKPLGTISESKNLSDFDVKTITGAMEYIIKYSEETWKCPVIFYTGTYYESAEYDSMVKQLENLQEKWNIGVINLYDNSEMNDIDKETYNLYMFDKIHPTKAGYLKWWLPPIEDYLYDYLL